MSFLVFDGAFNINALGGAASEEALLHSAHKGRYIYVGIFSSMEMSCVGCYTVGPASEQALLCSAQLQETARGSNYTRHVYSPLEVTSSYYGQLSVVQASRSR